MHALYHPTTVLLADDHPVVRTGYRCILEEIHDIQVVAEACNGEDAYKRYREYQPDVTILDLVMPGIGGIETIRRILAKTPHANVLVVSMHGSKSLVQRCKQAGARGYISKSSPINQLIEGIRQIAQGETFFDAVPEPDKTGGEGFGVLETLSQREFQVFQMLAEGHTVTDIAELLCISPKTVGVHQTHIMKKLGLINAAQLTRFAIRCGITTSY
jgi:two-component system invasion response regulator UvrY